MNHQQRLNISKQTEVRIILVGKTGNGKSSTGNSLLRKAAFRHESSPNAVTEKCQINYGTNVSNTVRYKVVDTPGLLDTLKSVSERALEIQRSVEICQEPHAFLLVFSATNRMTTDERFTIDILRIIFGEKVFKHSVVVFTHGQLFETDAEFKKFWTANKHFVDLINLCGNRVAKIENSTVFNLDNRYEDAESIIEIIKKMSGANNCVYNYPHLKVHKEVIEEHAQSYSGTGNIHEEVSEMVKRLGEKLDKNNWNVKLYGGIVLAVAATGGLGAGYLAGASANAVVASGLGATVMSSAGALGGAIARTAGSVANTAAASRVGTVVVNNGAAVGGAVVRTAWNVATKIRFW